MNHRCEASILLVGNFLLILDTDWKGKIVLNEKYFLLFRVFLLAIMLQLSEMCEIFY